MHLLQCTDRRAATQWNMEIKRLSAWLAEEKTNPILMQIIIDGIQDWRKDGNTTMRFLRGSNIIRLATEEQYAIGWYQFLLGRITHLFADAQTAHYKHIHSQKKGSTWAKNLIKEVWKITWHMWDNRNENLHTKTTPQKQREREQLLLQVEEQFEMGTADLAPHDHNKLRDKIKIIALPTPDLKLWIKSMELARDTVAREETRRANALRTQQENFRRFFTN